MPSRVVSAMPRPASRARCRHRRPRRSRRASKSPWLVTSRAWSWPVRRPSRTTRLRRKPLVRRGGRSRMRPCSRHQALTALAHGVDRARWRGCRRHVVDDVPAAGAVEAEHELAGVVRGRTSTRACCGSATARPPGRSARPADPRSRRCGTSASRDLALPSRSAGARRGAPATARPDARRAARSGRGSARATRPRGPRRRRACDFLTSRANAVAGDRALDEHDVAVERARRRRRHARARSTVSSSSSPLRGRARG